VEERVGVGDLREHFDNREAAATVRQR